MKYKSRSGKLRSGEVLPLLDMAFASVKKYYGTKGGYRTVGSRADTLIDTYLYLRERLKNGRFENEKEYRLINNSIRKIETMFYSVLPFEFKKIDHVFEVR